MAKDPVDQIDPADRTVIQVVRAGDRRATRREEWAYFLVHSTPGNDDPASAERLQLGETPLRIGRRAPCELLLADHEVSGLHCELRVVDSVVLVTDLGSTNGTFVDGQRAAPTLAMRNGSALQVGSRYLKLEVRDLRELAEAEVLQRDLERARRYVLSLLPPPLRTGAVRIEWCFEPSAKLGGDGFGYQKVDDYRTAFYLVDVAGHGIGAALHVVAVMNVLRQRTMADVDYAAPGQVLARLNALFPMDSHDGLFFTAWYGVYDARDRRLEYVSAGHHPAYRMGLSGPPALPLSTRNPAVGTVEAAGFAVASAQLDAGDRLYLFSDGVFEIVTHDGSAWHLADFIACLGAPHEPTLTEPEHLYRQVRKIAHPGPLDDDFSLLVVTLL